VWAGVVAGDKLRVTYPDDSGDTGRGTGRTMTATNESTRKGDESTDCGSTRKEEMKFDLLASNAERVKDRLVEA